MNTRPLRRTLPLALALALAGAALAADPVLRIVRAGPDGAEVRPRRLARAPAGLRARAVRYVVAVQRSDAEHIPLLLFLGGA